MQLKDVVNGLKAHGEQRPQVSALDPSLQKCGGESSVVKLLLLWE